MVKSEKKTAGKSVFREYVEAILIALLLALFIRTFVVQAFKIPSGSMIPTLLIGDHILVSKFSFGIKNPFTGATWVSIGEPHRNDVIVFKYPRNPAQDFIKRVIGVGGDQIQIVNKKVYINDHLIEDSHAYFTDRRVDAAPGRDNFGPVVVPAGKLFVMGDNRDNSHDSRFWNFVDLKAVRGNAFMLYWSWNREKVTVRWRRIGDLIH